MTTSFNHRKEASDLPLIPCYSPEQTKLILKNFNPLKDIQNKNPLSKLISQDSNANSKSTPQNKPTQGLINQPAKQTQFMKNSYNPKLQTISLGLGYPNMLQKMLQKSKKYIRVDAHLKTQNNMIKNDIECLIENLVQEKQRKDFIVINLRNKFQTNKRSLTLNQQNNTLLRKNQRNSTRMVQQQQEVSCPIKSVNHFTQGGKNLKNRKYDKSGQNSNQPLTAGCLLKSDVKSFKQIMKQYIKNYKSSMGEDLSKNTSILGTGYKMSSSTMTKSGNWQGNSMFNNPDEMVGNISKDNNLKSGNIYFKEFMQLADKSQDYLDYYLKSSFMTESSASSFKYGQVNECSSIILSHTRMQIEKMLKKMDKNAILSVLRLSAKCLQPGHNQKEIINRILLALNINPINEFHFIKQETFTKFRKLMTGQASRQESRQFLLRYFCLDSALVTKNHFNSLLYCILNKLLPILNDSTVEILFEKVKKISQQIIISKRMQEQKQSHDKSNKENNGKITIIKSKIRPPRLSVGVEKEQPIKDNKKQLNCQQSDRLSESQCYKRQQIKSMFFQDPFSMWDQILQLIFIV